MDSVLNQSMVQVRARGRVQTEWWHACQKTQAAGSTHAVQRGCLRPITTCAYSHRSEHFCRCIRHSTHVTRPAQCCNCFATYIAVLIVISVATKWFAVSILPITAVYVVVQVRGVGSACGEGGRQYSLACNMRKCTASVD
jgi:hypothetical protein